MKRHKILLVDDDVNILEVLDMRLRLMGYDVTAVEDPVEAITLVKQERFSLLLTDQRLGKIYGTELMEMVHQNDKFMPVIIMTAFGSIDDAVSSLKKGAYTYLEKPVDTQELAFHIQNAIRKKEIEENLALERKLWTNAVLSMGAGLILLDKDKKISWSQGVPKGILQDSVKGEDLTGNLLKDIVKCSVLLTHDSPIDLAFQTGEVQTIEYEDPDQTFTLLITATPVKGNMGEVKEVAVLFLDITKAKAAQKALIEQERLKGVLEMAGAVAHELSQPVQGILGWGEIILKNLDESDPNYEILQRICSQIDTIGDLIGRLTSITRYVTKDYPGSSGIIDIEKASTTRSMPAS